MQDSKNSAAFKDEAPQPFLQAGLINSFGLSKKSNSRVSIRSFARRLGTSHSAMSEILKGKRKVSKVKAEAFADALKITGDSRSRFLTDFNRVDPVGAELSDETFQLLADPDYFSLLTLVDTAGFHDSFAWMSKRLSIPEEKCERIFSALVSLNLIVKNSENKWVPTHNRVSVQNNVASQAIRKAHESSLESAKKALHEISLDQRFFISATMPTDVKRYEIAVSMLKDTINRISVLFETSAKEEIYKLQFAFFPITNLDHNFDNKKDPK